MKERPILMSSPMVRALLAGRKTQTRRIMNPPPTSEDWSPEVGEYPPTMIDKDGCEYPGPDIYGASDQYEGRRCPYGRPGDVLWVRETWQRSAPLGLALKVINYRADLRQWDIVSSIPTPVIANYGGILARDTGGWKSSLFMPRWASRITLAITDVRVQRLQEISDPDAQSEGVCDLPLGDCRLSGHVGMFRNLWESIIGSDSWAANPWVWGRSLSR